MENLGECVEQVCRGEGLSKWSLVDWRWQGPGSGWSEGTGRGLLSDSQGKRGFYVTLHLCFSRIWHSAWHVEDGNICLNE